MILVRINVLRGTVISNGFEMAGTKRLSRVQTAELLASLKIEWVRKLLILNYSFDRALS